MPYYYPDIFDQITLTIVQSKNLDVAYLEKAENTILSSAEKIFQKQKRHTLLDLGCGAGRLTIKFSQYFNRVTALDPDKIRLQNAKNNIADKKIHNVVYIQAPFLKAELPDEHFDVVLCNQIIQHIDTEMIKPIMQKIFNVLKPNGLIVLTTSYTDRADDFFIKSFLEKGKVATVEVSEPEFNGLTTNDREILPVHYFSSAMIKNHLARFTEIQLSIFDNLYPHSMLDTLLFIGEKPQ